MTKSAWCAVSLVFLFVFSGTLMKTAGTAAWAQSTQATTNYTYTVFNVPGSTATQVRGINNAGSLAGQFTDLAGVTHGYTNVGNTLTVIDAPGAVLTQVTGINNAGSVVGVYVDQSGLSHGFLDTGGAITTLDVPGSTITQAYGL